MKVRLNTVVKLLALGAAMTVASAASAQSAGQLTAKFGINRITPQIESGDVSAPALPGTKTDVGSSTRPVLIFAYGITDNISAEFAVGTPYKHALYGAGAIQGTGQLGTAEVIPPTLFAQYRFFEPAAMVRPYLGVGATYAYFQKETGSGQLTSIMDPGGPATTFKIDNKFAGTLQAGVAVAINARWFVDLAVTKTYLTTTAHYSTGQTQKVTFDPIAVIAAVGYKF